MSCDRALTPPFPGRMRLDGGCSHPTGKKSANLQVVGEFDIVGPRRRSSPIAGQNMPVDGALESLLKESAEQLRGSIGSPERIVLVVGMFLRRAFQAGMTADVVRDLLGITPGCLLDRAALPIIDEAAVVEAYASLEKALAKRYGAAKLAAGEVNR